MQVLVIGAGDIGFQLSRKLAQHDHDITIIESNSRRAKRVADQLDVLVVEGDATSFHILNKTHIDHVDFVAAMTTSDEVNLLACHIAKKMGAGSTIARVRNPEYTEPEFPLSAAETGVDLFIHPEHETAEAIVRLIRRASATDITEFADGKMQLLGLRLDDDSSLLGVPLRDLWHQFDHPPVRIAAVQRKQRTIIPGGEDKLAHGDQIFAICDPAFIPEFVELAGKHETNIDDIMILGGGHIGQAVAASFGRDTGVKIIESREEHSWVLAERLQDTLVIHGDGTDFDLLASEGILDMDALVAVTGNDETNIIATLLAHHLRVPRTIALVNKLDYLPITPTIGMDAVVSKQLLTVNAVQRYIQHQQVATIASLPGIDAHVIEYIATGGAKITSQPLASMLFPRNAGIGAIVHQGNLLIPRGDTQIQAGDKVVVFCLPQALQDVEKLFA